jgi:hypothetical protein
VLKAKYSKPGLISSGFFYALNFNMKTFTTYDKSTGYYTMTLIEKGGPIICGRNLERVKKDFEAALEFAFSVKKLRDYDGKND